LPALNSSTVLPTSFVTVPVFGLGMSPRGPSVRPSLPTLGIWSGVAIATSKSRKPFSIWATRSSAPTMSAPAASGLARLVSRGEHRDAHALPVPFGSDTVPRIIWSALRGSTRGASRPRPFSSNLRFDSDFTRSNASVGE
jgi:hypothetical protein